MIIGSGSTTYFFNADLNHGSVGRYYANSKALIHKFHKPPLLTHHNIQYPIHVKSLCVHSQMQWVPV
uniref:Uncharacterized protein n=1 Tax=Glossina morsitans morsitans TaxID=37546 RepID=A0A1B0FL31_GLOMM